MKITVGLDQAQKVVILTNEGVTVESGDTVVVSLYENMDDDTAYKSYTLADADVDYLVSQDAVLITTDSMFAEYPADGYYYTKVTVEDGVAEWGSVTFTLSIRSDVYQRIAMANPYSPDYEVSTKLHLMHMLLREMEEIQYLEFVNQKKIDFDVRMAQLKEIMSL